MVFLRAFGVFALVAMHAFGATAVRAQWCEVIKEGQTKSTRDLNISGMALLSESPEVAVFLVVHDNDQKPVAGILTISREKAIDYKSLDWTSEDVPDDLEAVTKVPDEENTFMALNSGGRVYYFRLVEAQTKKKSDSPWRIEFKAVFDLPAAGENFEGFALQKVDNVLVAVWADRGNSDRKSKLFWSVMDLKIPGVRKPVGGPQFVGVGYPTDRDVRHISDIKIDPTGRVFTSSASDPGDSGPFSSAIHETGVISAKGHAITFKLVQREIMRERRKIEAIEFMSWVAGGLAFGTDDENKGAAVYCTWKPATRN